MAKNRDPELGLQLNTTGFIAAANRAKTALTGIGSVKLYGIGKGIGNLTKDIAGFGGRIARAGAGIGKSLVGGIAGALGGGGVAGASGAVGGLLGGIAGSLGGPAGAALGAAAGAAVAKGLAGGIEKTVGAAIAETRINDRLRSTFGAANFDFLDETANSVKSAFAIDDEDAKSALSVLGTMGMSAKQSAAAISLVADVSRAKNLSMEQAAKLIGKAYQGSESAAKKLGLQIVKTGDPLRDQAALVDQIQKRFGGAAAQYAKNLPPFERVKLALDDVMKSIGGKLIPVVLPFVEWLQSNLLNLVESPAFGAFLDTLVGGLKAAWGWAQQIGKTLLTGAITFGLLIKDIPAALSKLWDTGKLMELFVALIGALMKTAWDACVMLGKLLWTGIMDAVPMIIGYIGKALIDTLRSVLGNYVSDKLGLGNASDSLNEMAKGSGSNLAKRATEAFADFGGKARENFAGMAAITKDALQTGGLDIDGARARAQGLVAGLAGAPQEVRDRIKQSTDSLYGQTGTASQTIGMSQAARQTAALKQQKTLNKAAAQQNKTARVKPAQAITINLQSADRLNPVMALS